RVVPTDTMLLFLCQSSAAHPDLPSFPTRRSSDLSHGARGGEGGREPRGGHPRGARRVLPGRDGQAHRRVPSRRGRAAHPGGPRRDRKSTRLNSSHVSISYAVFCLKKKNRTI